MDRGHKQKPMLGRGDKVCAGRPNQYSHSAAICRPLVLPFAYAIGARDGPETRHYIVDWRTFVSILDRRFRYRRIGCPNWAGVLGAIHANVALPLANFPLKWALPLANFPLKWGNKWSWEKGCQKPRQDDVRRLCVFCCKFGLNLDQVFSNSGMVIVPFLIHKLSLIAHIASIDGDSFREDAVGGGNEAGAGIEGRCRMSLKTCDQSQWRLVYSPPSQRTIFPYMKWKRRRAQPNR
jgi:hypothetical protein